MNEVQWRDALQTADPYWTRLCDGTAVIYPDTFAPGSKLCDLLVHESDVLFEIPLIPGLNGDFFWSKIFYTPHPIDLLTSIEFLAGEGDCNFEFADYSKLNLAAREKRVFKFHWFLSDNISFKCDKAHGRIILKGLKFRAPYIGRFDFDMYLATSNLSCQGCRTNWVIEPNVLTNCITSSTCSKIRKIAIRKLFKSNPTVKLSVCSTSRDLSPEIYKYLYDIVYTLVPLKLSDYILLWILDFLPHVVHVWTDFAKVNLIKSVRKSIVSLKKQN